MAQRNKGESRQSKFTICLSRTCRIIIEGITVDKNDVKENIRKSRRIRDRYFYLLYIMPFLFMGTYFLTMLGVAKDAADFAPPEGTYGVPFLLFAMLGMFAGIGLSAIVLIVIIVIMCVKMYKHKKYEKSQIMLLRSMGAEPDRIMFQKSWLWMLLPLVFSTVLYIVYGRFFGTIFWMVVLMNCVFWIWKILQLTGRNSTEKQKN